MNLQTTALALVTLFPLSTFAVPTPEGVSVPIPIEANTLEASDPSPEAIGLIHRDVVCKILGSGNVNCRTGPGFSYPEAYVVAAGHRYNFDCYMSGDCYEGIWFVLFPLCLVWGWMSWWLTGLVVSGIGSLGMERFAMLMGIILRACARLVSDSRM